MRTPHPRRAVITGDRFHPNIPTEALYAGREAPYLKRSPYANPHPVGTEGRKPKPCPVPACHGAVHDRMDALRLYAQHLDAHAGIVDQAAAEPVALFACRCLPDERCHVDVLLYRVDELLRAVVEDGRVLDPNVRRAIQKVTDVLVEREITAEFWDIVRSV